MQNVNATQPGVWTHRIFHENGSEQILDQNAAYAYTLITQSGYTGVRPATKPIPPHNYGLNVQDISLVHDSLYSYATGKREIGKGAGLYVVANGIDFQPPYDWTALINRGINRLNDSVRGGLDLSTDIAEAGKTRKMLNLVDQAVDYTDTFRKRFGPARAASNAWLAYNYGMKPLAQSIFGVADELSRTVINKLQHYRVTESDYSYAPDLAYVRAVVGRIGLKPSGSHKRSVSFGMDLWQDQFDLSRWSSLNPVSIAWELLPYSFVADWFLNVGGYLRNLETCLLYSSRFRSGYRTTLSAGDISLSIVDVGKNSSMAWSSKWTGHVRYRDINRTVLSGYPAYTLPTFDVQLGSSRLTSAAALLGQMLGRR